nr:MAG TPA: hypothetical protein [Caudoviricetes sp.]
MLSSQDLDIQTYQYLQLKPLKKMLAVLVSMPHQTAQVLQKMIC